MQNSFEYCTDSTMGNTALVVHDYVCKVESGVFVLTIELVKVNGYENAVSVNNSKLILIENSIK